MPAEVSPDLLKNTLLGAFATNGSAATKLAMKMPIGEGHSLDNLPERVPICSQIRVTICDKIGPDKPHSMTAKMNLL
jgi:hypothetical protein